MANVLLGLILGMVQGVMEWLPISSEGINALIMVNIFEVSASEAIQFSIWLHTGTLFAALIFFRKDVVTLLRHLPQYLKKPTESDSSKESRLTTFLIVSTVLSGAIGLPLVMVGLSETLLPGGMITVLIGVFLIVTGLVQRYGTRVAMTAKEIELKDALILGIVQAFSVLPGLSRSGLTVSALLFRKYAATEALKLSFLMSIPAVLIAEIGLGLLGRIDLNIISMVGILTSFVFGILTIDFLMKIAIKIPFWRFCIFLGMLCLLALWYL